MTETIDNGAHLWEVDHPYYCARGNFYARDCHTNYETWGEFIADVGAWDMDMNLLFRWDWHKPERGVMGTLETFWVGQRKASLWSLSVPVHSDEEPEVRAFLQVRFEHLLTIWAPLATPAVA